MTQVPIFAISMERSVERREKLSKSLAALGLEVEYVPAVDGKQLAPALLETYQKRRGIIEGGDYAVLPAEIGCALSHVRCAQLIEERQLDGAIILEDDVIPLPALADFARHFDASDARYRKGSMIFLGGLEDENPEAPDRKKLIVGSLFQRIPLSSSTQLRRSVDSERFFLRACAYYLDRQSAQKLVAFNKDARTVADNWRLFSAEKVFQHIYYPVPWAAEHPSEEASPSLLEPERLTLRKLGVPKKRSRLSSMNRRLKNFIRPPFRRLLALLK